MEAKWWWKVFFVILLVVISLLYLVPTVADKDSQGDAILPSWYPFKNSLRPGLDLKGGIHMVLGVEWEKALVDDAVHKAENLKDWCKDKQVPFDKIYSLADTHDIILTFKSKAEAEKYGPQVLEDWKILIPSPLEAPDENSLRITYDEREITNLKDGAIRQALDTIRRRIDPSGTGEMVIARQGESSILVQMPGFTNVDRARNLIGQTAQLEFRMVVETEEATRVFEKVKDNLPPGVKRSFEGNMDYISGAELKPMMDLVASMEIPVEFEVLFEKTPDDNIPDKFTYRSWTVFKRVELTGDKLEDARVYTDRTNKPYVSVDFNPEGSKIFAQVTGDNVGKKMAIVLDDEVRSAPVIKEKIPSGQAQITLGSMKSQQQLFQEARDLAVVLRAGALPAPVNFQEVRTVGATLGADSIAKGKRAIIVSGIAVMGFMAVYYNLAGVGACVALLLNLIFILASMVGFQATMTMPGLAGIALTLGMAVDANVIINERIREELRLGKTPRSAVETGYGKAFWTIFDSNITTALAAFVLWSYGSGPVQGFAITLLIGIAASMFTAIVVTRIMVDFYIARFKPTKLSV